MTRKQVITLFAAFCYALSPVVGQAQEKTQQEVEKEKKMEWFAKASQVGYFHPLGNLFGKGSL